MVPLFLSPMQSRSYLLLLLCLSAFHFAVTAQSYTVEELDSSRSGVSFRGLSTGDNGVVWVSGSKGTIGKTVDGGKTWQWVNPKGFEKRDFRDIEAFDADHAVAMAIDSPGVILKTADGGKNWKVVYESHQQGIFLDAMDFRGDEGLCVGDPIDGKIWLLHTKNKGDSWELLPDDARPSAYPGEAFFAASGTNVVMTEYLPELMGILVSGGSHSRMFLLSKKGDSPVALPLPIMQGGAMTGSNSILAMPRFPMVAAGDYSNSSRQDSCIYLMDNLLQPAQMATSSAIGYASCLSYFGRDSILACGLGGVAIYRLPDAVLSKDGVWTMVDKEPWHVMEQAKGGGNVFLAGPRGRIGVIRK